MLIQAVGMELHPQLLHWPWGLPAISSPPVQVQNLMPGSFTSCRHPCFYLLSFCSWLEVASTFRFLSYLLKEQSSTCSFKESYQGMQRFNILIELLVPEYVYYVQILCNYINRINEMWLDQYTNIKIMVVQYLFTSML